MLRVTVELVPFGDENRKEEIASMIIGNMGKGDEGYTYDVNRVERGAHSLGIEPSVESFIITGHERRQSVWSLVEKAAAYNSSR